MKKTILTLFLAALLTGLLSGCGGGSNTSGADTAPRAAPDSGEMESGEIWETEEAGIADSSSGERNPVYDSSMLILRGSISAEATDFSSAVSALEQQVSKAGGYIESSSITGSVGSRWASFTIRVPREQFETTFDAVGQNCHITESSRSSENVSAAYYDAETRRTALETKRDRLLALLAKAESMEDIIALENALSDVQYEIERLSGTLRGYDRLIAFSTIEVYLSEVRDLSVVQKEASFLNDLKAAAVTGTRGLVSFLQGVLLALVYGWWFFLSALIVLILLLIRFRKRRHTQAAPLHKPAPPAGMQSIPKATAESTDPADPPGKNIP